MSKYVLLIGKEETVHPTITLADDYNKHMDELKDKYEMYYIDNDPPEYNKYTQVAIIENLTELISNADINTHTTHGTWKITTIDEDTKKQRINNYNNQQLFFIKQQMDEYINNTLINQFKYIVNDRTHCLIIDMDRLEFLVMQDRIEYPFYIPTLRMELNEKPDIEDIEETSQKYNYVPDLIVFNNYDELRALIIDYLNKFGEVYNSYGNSYKNVYCNDYNTLVELMKNKK